MNAHTFTLTDTPDPADSKFVWDGLAAYNRQFAPEDGYRPLTIFVRGADGALVGGLLGETYWGWLHISILWLEQGVRGQGYGERLLKMAEAEAIARGCHHAHLDTMSFQARPFYEKHGYTVFAVLNDVPTGHSRYSMQKILG